MSKSVLITQQAFVGATTQTTVLWNGDTTYYDSIEILVNLAAITAGSLQLLVTAMPGWIDPNGAPLLTGPLWTAPGLFVIGLGKDVGAGALNSQQPLTMATFVRFAVVTGPLTAYFQVHGRAS